MSEQINDIVVKVNSALSNQATYIRTSDQTQGIESILKMAVEQLQASGKPLESKQLDELVKSHRIFNGDKEMSKGTLLSEMTKTQTKIGEQTVQVVEVNLVAAHSGGMGDFLPIHQKLNDQLVVIAYSTIKESDGIFKGFRVILQKATHGFTSHIQNVDGSRTYGHDTYDCKTALEEFCERCLKEKVMPDYLSSEYIVPLLEVNQ